MVTQSETFGRLLRGSINSIAAYEGRSAAAIEEELGDLIGLSGAAIQRYKSGTIPPEARTVQILADAAVRRGYLGRAWLQRFLQAAQFPAPAELIARLVGEPGSPATLPAGTLAFLFTDIAGSTSRWERERAAMEQALIRHDLLLRQAIELAGGQVFKTVGDAFYAVFATAPAALEAALVAQRAILAEPWPTEAPLRVRMAIHVGAAEPRDGDYFGAPLNRVARLCAAGHGGQILLSAAAWELACDLLPEAVGLRALGERRLKDLGRPERIYQLVAPDLPADFPPLTALDAYRHNLPAQPTALIGRERETDSVCALLRAPGARLVTLVGPGGIGKTRLALQAAAELVDAYPDGVWWAPLAAVRDQDGLAEQIAAAVGAPRHGARPAAEQVRDFLRHRQLLLVLDNFEQIVAAASLVGELLADAPGVVALVTSRTTLHLYGERAFAVPTLELPDPQQPPAAERLPHYTALRLFIERAQAVRPDFAVTNETAPVIAEICARLDGLPLAIELAAARVRLFTPRALLARLDRRLALLTGGARDLPARHQTLRDTIAWSYDMLDIAEQTLFARLSVFAGGWTVETAELVCGDGAAELALAVSLPAQTIAGLLEALAGKSLIRLDEGSAGEPRLVMLETLREFAREQLAASGEEEALRNRHLAAYVRLTAEAEPLLRGPDAELWMARLDAERDNLHTALAWGLEGTEADVQRRAAGLELAGRLWYAWARAGQLAEAERWLSSLWATDPALPALARARALVGRECIEGIVKLDWSPIVTLTEESLAVVRTAGDPDLLARALAELAMNKGLVLPQELRQQYAEESLALARSVADRWLEAMALLALGHLQRYPHPLGGEGSSAILLEGLALVRRVGDTWLLARALYLVATAIRNRWATSRAIRPAARGLFGEALALAEQRDDRFGQSRALWGLAGVAYNSFDWGLAQTYYRRLLPLEDELEPRWGRCRPLRALAEIAIDQGAFAEGVRLAEESMQLAQAHGQRNQQVEAAHLLVRAALLQGQWGRAEDLVAELDDLHYEIFPWQAHLMRGRTLLTRGDVPGALELIAAAQRAAAGSPGWWSDYLTAERAMIACYGDGAAEAVPELVRAAAFRAQEAERVSWALITEALGQSHLRAGDSAAARSCFVAILELWLRADAQPWAARALDGLAAVAAFEGQWSRAARWWGAAEAIRTRLGAICAPIDTQFQKPLWEAAYETLGSAVFSVAIQAGRELSQDALVAEMAGG